MAKRILIIEDEQSLIQALLDNFEGNGYEVETALDGEEGWKKMKANRPDLILLDLILPKMDGFELLNKIKRDDDVKNVPVVVLTNLSDVAEKCQQLGAKYCFVKSDESIDNIKKAVEDSLAE